MSMEELSISGGFAGNKYGANEPGWHGGQTPGPNTPTAADTAPVYSRKNCSLAALKSTPRGGLMVAVFLGCLSFCTAKSGP